MSRPDLYASFAELTRAERSGVDYRVRLLRRDAGVVIVAPHGGGIEPGTSELAAAIAGEQFSLYCFEGLKAGDNGGLHVTSHRFDDPACLRLVESSTHVVTIHGCGDLEGTGGPDLSTSIGGRDTALGEAIRRALVAGGFGIGDRPEMPGTDPRNICNRGRRAMGVQLEISRSLRDRLLQSVPAGPAGEFAQFASAIRRGIVAHKAP